ncbi:hypothetical protein CLIB1444_10S03378 [[Candida] jaroonii]|uniref:Uncharacterized protein n=1 Tax=[Candida] jaroonii TaxID=467808 RepID=A0ACA9YD93_9ASCO|nr:hypothetical protein CLIB1444_10S03378 [[Candida] jaroonii]
MKPPHSRNQSISSGMPFKANKLSRASTNTEYYENQSLRTLDQIPSVKPSITYSDKLWTQIDVLDDVKTMSQQVKEKGSFFNDQFNEDLNKLKQSQEKLIEVMADDNFVTNDNFKRQKERYKTDEYKKDKFHSKNDNSVYKKKNFDEINNYVNNVKDNLDKVGESMKNFEDTTRDLW